MIFPDFLKKGDKIAIISPASAVNPSYIDGACHVLEQWGYVPVLGKHCKGKTGYFSGTTEERIRAFIIRRCGVWMHPPVTSCSIKEWKSSNGKR